MFTTKFHVKLCDHLKLISLNMVRKSRWWFYASATFFVGINLHVLDCVPDT